MIAEYVFDSFPYSARKRKRFRRFLGESQKPGGIIPNVETAGLAQFGFAGIQN
jgi:hypothetical protein